MENMEELGNVAEMKKELYRVHSRCNMRGLKATTKWLAELIFSLDQVDNTSLDLIKETSHPKDLVESGEYDCLTMAQSFLDGQEYQRVMHFTKDCIHPIPSFLHHYATYLDGEMKKVDDEVSLAASPKLHLNHLKSLLKSFKTNLDSSDAYQLYLYGVVLSKLDLQGEAISRLVQSVKLEPLLWCSWLELSKLCPNLQSLESLELPEKHWIYKFFLGKFCLSLQYNDQALEHFKLLTEGHFSKSTYLMAQIALANHNIRDVDPSIEAFTKLREVDPYRLENMDTYSNLLYIREMKAELAHLAQHCSDIDKYRVETCCIIGNYYSLKTQHDKAVQYFQRAIKLDPCYLTAWTLMGHEYMELKSTSAAILSYRRAIDVNKRDYRAWYGLGQTYEILKMSFYSLYYYKQAHLLRPNDSRMVVALGEAYDKLGWLQEAKRCYWKARSLGDLEGLALLKLANLFEKLDDNGQAAGAYTAYINETIQLRRDGQGHAFRFLANFHFMNDNLEDAYIAAQRCSDYPEVKEEGKALLKQLAGWRLAQEGSRVYDDQPLNQSALQISSPCSFDLI